VGAGDGEEVKMGRGEDVMMGREEGVGAGVQAARRKVSSRQ
jgi:hypothetical protein